jgi:hypothetical protein
MFPNFFTPQPDELLRRISRHIDDAMLKEIAAADYGQDIEEHLVQLRRIRDECSFPIPMPWHPGEVLELIRWSEPDAPNWKPSGYGERGHWMRAFACAALLRAAGDLENDALRGGWNSTVSQLISSLRVLHSELYQPASALLAWLILKCESDEDIEELGFLGVALLWLALQLRPAVSDDVIVSLSDWIVIQEKKRTRDVGPYIGGWLLGITFFNSQHKAWIELGGALENMNLQHRSFAAQKMVKLIGGKLAGTLPPE